MTFEHLMSGIDDLAHGGVPTSGPHTQIGDMMIARLRVALRGTTTRTSHAREVPVPTMIAAIIEVIAHQWSPHTELTIIGTLIAEQIRSAPVIPITRASTPPAFEETSIAAETTTLDRSIPAMIVTFPSAHHRARTTPTPTIGSTTTGVTPARHDIFRTIEITTTGVMTPIVDERTIAFGCRRA